MWEPMWCYWGNRPAPEGCHYKALGLPVVAHVFAESSGWVVFRLALAVDGYCGTSNTGVVSCTLQGVILRADTAGAGCCKGFAILTRWWLHLSEVIKESP
nr:MAG TPA_asm: hypothetical protein [Caudoviricetes sp.]